MSVGHKWPCLAPRSEELINTLVHQPVPSPRGNDPLGELDHAGEQSEEPDQEGQHEQSKHRICLLGRYVKDRS